MNISEKVIDIVKGMEGIGGVPTDKEFLEEFQFRLQALIKTDRDSIVQQVCEEYSQRGKVGLEKYGVTLDREDLTKEQWIQHAKEEAMDLTLYLTKIQKLL
jgi:hypothetical protein